MEAVTAQNVIDFWFNETKPEKWFAKDAAFDDLIVRRFSETLQRARRGELFSWRDTLEGRLAEVIVLDQFARNIYRGQGAQFAGDGMALVLAEEAVAREDHRSLAGNKKSFLYMPYMHSESPTIHKIAVELFSQPGLEYSLEYELRHKEIIDRFNRFPHRNAMLGRMSTPEEIEFLKQDGSSF